VGRGARLAAAGAGRISRRASRSPNARFSARLEELAAENRALGERLARLEIRPAPAAARRAPLPTGLVTREELETFRDEVLAALGQPRSATGSPGTPTGSVERKDLREYVSEALTEIRKEEAAARFPSLEERAAELDETMPKLEAWLDLTREQSGRMRSALLSQYEREADVLRRWQEGADARVLATMKRDDREVHLAELAEILTPEQLEAYASRREWGGK